MTIVFILVLAIAAFGFTLYPLFRASSRGVEEFPLGGSAQVHVLASLDSARRAMEDLESDFESGVIAQAEYDRLKAEQEADKAVVQRKINDPVDSGDSDSYIERQVSQLRAHRPQREAAAGVASHCRRCGSQAAKGDLYCARCGNVLRVKN